MGKLNTRIQLKRDTTENWNNATGFIPLQGEIILYTDYKKQTKKVDGETIEINIPGIKVGDGMAYVQDLPFIDGDLRSRLMNHINDMEIHATMGEKLFWNNKINVDDDYESVHDELVEETLVINRN